ncbi:hypothetical protein M9Y10_033327 [Tritrichomonas musculus]|uniref:Haloacid dehalogenase-like hydrolase family protein n=1 Tax=Tritrichomonas musculus TaxID=1915356 RepID=A0ABR2KBV0_9EUKA
MYKLIALDMDGTLLNSHKEISIVTQESLALAQKSGKICALATGRCLSELIPYKKELTNVQYGICESGSLIYDFFNKKIIGRKGTISHDIALKIAKAVSDEDVMIQIMCDGISYVNEHQIPLMKNYRMGQYESLYRETSEKVNNIIETIINEKRGIEKINIYHTSKDIRDKTFKKLSDLPLQFAFAEESSLEISPLNISKATGLEELCSYLNLPIQCTIAVGDGNNDLPILGVAGLSIAVGNANDNVKKVCDVIVSDNDHDGCHEAILSYLLKQ